MLFFYFWDWYGNVGSPLALQLLQAPTPSPSWLCTFDWAVTQLDPFHAVSFQYNLAVETRN